MNRIMPPAVCNAASETPSCRRVGSPNSANESTIKVAMKHGLGRDRPPFSPRHIGGQRGEQHSRVDGADDRKKGGEGG